MKKNITFVLFLLLTTGCTTLITAPISAVGAVAGAAIDVGSAGVRAVTGGDD
jgi:hypothetical protein